jgi:hypothetical protein
MFNPNDEKHIQRLRDSMTYSYRKLEPFRANQLDVLQQYVGNHYSDHGSDDKVPVNYMAMAIMIYVRQLAARSPRVFVTVPDITKAQLFPQAAAFEAAINVWLNRINFGKSMYDTVMNAMFSMGITKSGIAFDGATTHPFCDAISLHDWVHDMTAKRWDQVRYMGDKYWMDYEYVMEGGLFDKKAIDGLAPSEKSIINDGGTENASSITQDSAQSDQSFRPQIQLQDVFVTDGYMITMTAEESKNKPMLVREWDGPPGGPYDVLSFGDVPDNTPALAPTALWRDLHDLSNRLMRKMGRQAERQKTILGIRTGDVKDGKRVVDANDGEAVVMDNPESAKEYRFGGIDAPNMAFSLQLKALLSQQMGNLETMGGLASMAKTASQEGMLNENSSANINDLRDRTAIFTKRRVTDMGFYLYSDPLIDIRTSYRIPKVDYDFPVIFNRDTRKGTFNDFELSIEPYSMAHQTPEGQLRQLDGIMKNYVLPLMPQMAQQGIRLDFQKLFNVFSKYTNTPELGEILIFGSPPPPAQPGQGQGQGQQPGMPNNTTRTYERVSRPGATQQGQDQVMARAMMGMESQPSEMAALMREAG